MLTSYILGPENLDHHLNKQVIFLFHKLQEGLRSSV